MINNNKAIKDYLNKRPKARDAEFGQQLMSAETEQNNEPLPLFKLLRQNILDNFDHTHNKSIVLIDNELKVMTNENIIKQNLNDRVVVRDIKAINKKNKEDLDNLENQMTLYKLTYNYDKFNKLFSKHFNKNDNQLTQINDVLNLFLTNQNKLVGGFWNQSLFATAKNSPVDAIKIYNATGDMELMEFKTISITDKTNLYNQKIKLGNLVKEPIKREVLGRNDFKLSIRVNLDLDGTFERLFFINGSGSTKLKELADRFATKDHKVINNANLDLNLSIIDVIDLLDDLHISVAGMSQSNYKQKDIYDLFKKTYGDKINQEMDKKIQRAIFGCGNKETAQKTHPLNDLILNKSGQANHNQTKYGEKEQKVLKAKIPEEIIIEFEKCFCEMNNALYELTGFTLNPERCKFLELFSAYKGNLSEINILNNGADAFSGNIPVEIKNSFNLNGFNHKREVSYIHKEQLDLKNFNDEVMISFVEFDKTNTTKLKNVISARAPLKNLMSFYNQEYNESKNRLKESWKVSLIDILKTQNPEIYSDYAKEDIIQLIAYEIKNKNKTLSENDKLKIMQNMEKVQLAIPLPKNQNLNQLQNQTDEEDQEQELPNQTILN